MNTQPLLKQDNIAPGIYDISNEAYHQGPGISRSALMEFRKSPYHYWYKYLNPDYKPKAETPALLFGKAFHTLALEPDKFEGYGNVLTAYQRKLFADLEPMVESLKKNKVAMQLIENAQIEKSLYWTDPDTGVLCKCRPDILHSCLVADLKTAQDGSAWSFSKAIYDYGYHIQAAMIREALQALKKITVNDFFFIVIEKSAPFVTTVYQLDKKSIDKGQEEFVCLLQRYKQCLASNHWPSYEAQEVSLPRYAFN